MIHRNEIVAYVSETYGVEPDYPWARTPNYAILRHLSNRKWFGAILDVTPRQLGLNGDGTLDILNLKCEPMLIGSLRGRPGILPGYHMNKQHWITILLKESLSKEEVCGLIDLSYDMTK